MKEVVPLTCPAWQAWGCAGQAEMEAMDADHTRTMLSAGTGATEAASHIPVTLVVSVAAGLCVLAKVCGDLEPQAPQSMALMLGSKATAVAGT